MSNAAVLPQRDARRHTLSERPEHGGRTAAQRDRDRILYTSAFRRLSGITQVASPTELTPVHNRLIHSLKVAQVGRSLAERLLGDPLSAETANAVGGLDPDVVEAAALAHDLGHPPFGHVTERTLDALLVAGGSASGVPDGYDNNAQSFRIVTKLAVRDEDVRGLNLTRATLNAILKYPWERGTKGLQHRKWGVYGSEVEDFWWCRVDTATEPEGCTLEARLMDWADDITYAVHDVEDFFRAGLIPLERFAKDTRECERFLDKAIEHAGVTGAEAETLSQAFLNHELVVIGVPGPYQGTRADRAVLRKLTSTLIGRYVNRSVSLIRRINGEVEVAIDAQILAEVRILKALTWYYVIASPALVAQRYGQRALITSLFEIFCQAAATRPDWTVFPGHYREEIEQTGNDTKRIKRVVADLISGMSEAQVAAVHAQLTGQSLTSVIDRTLR
jgi:dGTPase